MVQIGRQLFFVLWATTLAASCLAQEDLATEDEEAPSAPESAPVESATEAVPGEDVPAGESHESIEATIQGTRGVYRGIFRPGIIDRLNERWSDAMKWTDEKMGLRFTVEYNSVVQWADRGGDESTAGSGEFRLSGRWKLWGQETGNPGLIDAQLRSRHAYSELPPTSWSSSIGSLWPTANGFNDSGWAVPKAYFQQSFGVDRWMVRLGRTAIDGLYDVHALRGQRLFFLNSAFADNPAVPFPGIGPAIIVAHRPASSVKLQAGISGSEFLQLGSVGDQFRDNEWFSAFEFEWTPKLSDRGQTVLRAMYWHSRADSGSSAPDGDGVSTVVQHRFANSTVAFARYSFSSTTASTAEQVVATGVGYMPRWGRRTDLAGLAFAWGRPSVSGLRDQYTVEWFYRLQITPEVQLTPDVQAIINPSLSAEQDLVWVLGARLRIAF